MKNRLDIFFLQGDYPFCYYYRGYLPGIYSNQTVVSEFFRKDQDVSNEKFTEKALRADVVCFQRPSSVASLELAKLLKQRGKYVIFDNDDTYSGIPIHRLGNEKQVQIARNLNENLNRFLAIADGVTTTNAFLAEEYGKLNSNVAILKNCVDPLDELPCKPNTTGKFRVGVIGSVTSNDDYIHIKDQLKKLCQREDVTLVIMGIKLPSGGIMTESMREDWDFWASLPNTEWHPVCHVTDYYSTVANLALDLAIIPRKEHYFNQCKSNLKFLDMSLLRIPVLAQGFSDGTSPYQQDRDFCTIVTDNSLWYDSIIRLKEKYSEYKLLADKAHDYILQEYNIATYWPTWQKSIEKLCKFRPSF